MSVMRCPVRGFVICCPGFTTPPFTTVTEASGTVACRLMKSTAPPPERLPIGQLLINLLRLFRAELASRGEAGANVEGIRPAHLQLFGVIKASGSRLTELADSAGLSLSSMAELSMTSSRSATCAASPTHQIAGPSSSASPLPGGAQSEPAGRSSNRSSASGGPDRTSAFRDDVPDNAGPPRRARPGDQTRLRHARRRMRLARSPQSRAWQPRARIGRRIRWYETPDEV